VGFLLYRIRRNIARAGHAHATKMYGTFSLAASMPLAYGSFAVQNGYPAVL
jgi:hypothetical protein